jgi:type VI secretion system (T6SS) effector Tae4 (amidase)
MSKEEALSVASTIPISIDTIRLHYPRRTSKEGQFGGKLAHPDLRKVMARNPGTPCCVQVSHTLNKGGFPVTAGYEGQWRPPDGPWTIDGIANCFFILAVNEMENYITDRFFPGELLSKTDDGRKRTAQEIKQYIKDRPGLLIMRDSTPGVHTEFWTGDSFLQTDMAVDHLLGLPRVLFWDCTLAAPKWLQDYMATQPPYRPPP